MPVMTVDETRDVVDYEIIEGNGAVKQLTATKIQVAGKKRGGALLQIRGGQVEFRFDKDAANLVTGLAANGGFVISDGGYYTLRGHNQLSQFRFIAAAGDFLVVHYYA